MLEDMRDLSPSELVMWQIIEVLSFEFSLGNAPSGLLVFHTLAKKKMYLSGKMINK